MITTIRRIGQPGLLRYSHFKHERSTDDGRQRWRVVGRLQNVGEDFHHVIWADSEEHALLAVLLLTQGGAVKINGNVITDDLALPRRHSIDRTATPNEPEPISDPIDD